MHIQFFVSGSRERVRRQIWAASRRPSLTAWVLSALLYLVGLVELALVCIDVSRGRSDQVWTDSVSAIGALVAGAICGATPWWKVRKYHRRRAHLLEQDIVVEMTDAELIEMGRLACTALPWSRVGSVEERRGFLLLRTARKSPVVAFIPLECMQPSQVAELRAFLGNPSLRMPVDPELAAAATPVIVAGRHLHMAFDEIDCHAPSRRLLWATWHPLVRNLWLWAGGFALAGIIYGTLLGVSGEIDLIVVAYLLAVSAVYFTRPWRLVRNHLRAGAKRPHVRTATTINDGQLSWVSSENRGVLAWDMVKTVDEIDSVWLLRDERSNALYTLCQRCMGSGNVAELRLFLVNRGLLPQASRL